MPTATNTVDPEVQRQAALQQQALSPNSISQVAGSSTPTVTTGNVNANAFNPSPSIGSWAFANVNSTAVSPQGGSESGGSRASSDLLGTASNIKSAYNFLGGDTFGSITRGINEFGGHLGFADYSTQASTLASEGSAATGTLSGALGGAGFGFAAGGFLAGLVGGNQMGGSIGGAIGGALGATFLGGMAGVELGATLGSIVPGIGTVIGAVAGSLLGSMFGGGGTPHPASYTWGGMVNADGSISGAKYASKHIGNNVAESVQGDFQNYLQSQAKKYGLTYADNIAFFGGSGKTYYDKDKDGTIGLSTTPDFWKSEASKTQGSGQNVRIGPSYYKGGDDTTKLFNFNLNDAKSRQEAYDNAFNYILTSSGLDPKTIQPVNSTATNVNIPSQQTPSEWQKFLADYRTKHPATTPQNPPTAVMTQTLPANSGTNPNA